MRNISFALVVIGLLSQIGFAQNFDKIKLDKYFDTLETNNKFMGSVAISQNGNIIYTKQVGFADVEKEINPNANTKYRIGSISKTFTAVLVLKAAEEGKLDLNQTIDKYFPSIKNSKKITIKHLLNHRSGIHSFTNDKDYLKWNTHPKTEKEMLAIIENAGSGFEPDSKGEYSNSNYVLLTYILEKTFKTSYSALLRKYITESVGLVNTFLGGKINAKNNESRSYSFIEAWKLQPETDISIPLGAGGIISTPSDLVRFSNALFGGKILRKESIELMKSIKDGYGIGLFKVPFYDKVGYGHTGGIDGFSSVFYHFPDGNISFALTSNGSSFNNNDIVIAALSAVYNKPYDIPNFSTFNISSEDLDKYLGVYSSKEIPIKITFSKKGNILISQATGQPAFELEATEENKFEFHKAGIVLEFNPSGKIMLLKQSGKQFTFTKE